MSDVSNGAEGFAIGGVRIVAAHRPGYDALLTADWPSARDYFEAAVRDEETPGALEGLGIAAFQLGDADATFKARERAYELYRRRGDPLSAARVACVLTVDCVIFRGAIALANGWLRRTQSMLATLPESAEHGWFALLEAEKALLYENDCAAAETHALEAVRVASNVGDSDLEAEALAV